MNVVSLSESGSTGVDESRLRGLSYSTSRVPGKARTGDFGERGELDCESALAFVVMSSKSSSLKSMMRSGTLAASRVLWLFRHSYVY